MFIIQKTLELKKVLLKTYPLGAKGHIQQTVTLTADEGQFIGILTVCNLEIIHF